MAQLKGIPATELAKSVRVVVVNDLLVPLIRQGDARKAELWLVANALQQCMAAENVLEQKPENPFWKIALREVLTVAETVKCVTGVGALTDATMAQFRECFDAKTGELHVVAQALSQRYRKELKDIQTSAVAEAELAPEVAEHTKKLQESPTLENADAALKNFFRWKDQMRAGHQARD
eukprot:6492672-Amphidinium_carterae.2